MTLTRLALTTTGAALATGAAQAETDVWQVLSEIGIEEIVTEDSYEVRKSYPPALASGDIRDVEITGYATPALPGDMVQELLMVADMGTCPFCGSQDHGGTLVVSLADPIPVMEDSTRITLRGTLTRVTDPETWQSVALTDAVLLAD